MNEIKKIGILGGMGPEASLNAYKRLLKYCQEKYDSVQDYEYPSVVLNSLQLFGFEETGFIDQSKVLDQLVKGVKLLEKAGCNHVFIPCNTVHFFHKEMQNSSKIKILNIIEETSKVVKKCGHKKVGILSSESTKDLELYKRGLEKYSIESISVSNKDQKILNQIIKTVMAGKQSPKERNLLKQISQALLNQKATAVILGCTELPLAISENDCEFKIFDSLQIVVEASVDFAFKH